MQVNTYVSELITRAGAKVGSEYKLAKLMEVHQPVMSQWKSGARTCMPADRARLAAFAGEDAVQELVRATIEQAKEGPKREQLVQVLGKLSRQTGAATVSGLLGLASLTSLASSQLIRCILC